MRLEILQAYSPQALAGGGVNPKPGELSLASEGILFLDELKESSNYYILKNIECQKKSNQNKGAAILNE